MRIPKQSFTSRFKWQLVSSAAFVLVVGSIWGLMTYGTPYRSQARIGNIVFATINGRDTLQLLGSPARADAQPSITAASPVPHPSVPTSSNPKLRTDSVQMITPPRKIVPTEPTNPTLGLYVDPAIAAEGVPRVIAEQPLARWYGGWTSDVTSSVNATVSAAAAIDKAPVLVAYNIPSRDCGSYSAGGAVAGEAYKTWIREFAAGIGQRKAIVVLEPDALAGLSCLDSAGQQSRMNLIADAVTVLKGSTGASVYIDGGNARWVNAKMMASRLEASNVAIADGFSLNVSNFITTSESKQYGDELAQYVGKRYVIDTGRNGRGPATGNEWCNPHGRALGERPTTNTGQASIDAYLWIKVPGESDGACNGGPGAGAWWPDYANELIDNSH